LRLLAYLNVSDGVANPVPRRKAGFSIFFGAFVSKRDGVCNPVTYVFRLLAYLNVSDGVANPVPRGIKLYGHKHTGAAANKSAVLPFIKIA